MYGPHQLSKGTSPGIYSRTWEPCTNSIQTPGHRGRPWLAQVPITSGSASGTSWRSSVCMSGFSVEPGRSGRSGASSSRFSGPSSAVGLTPVSMTTHSWLNLLLSKDCKGNREGLGGILSWVDVGGRVASQASDPQRMDGPSTDSDANLRRPWSWATLERSDNSCKNTIRSTGLKDGRTGLRIQHFQLALGLLRASVSASV